MTLEKLKELLESGAITQEEFDDMVKTLQPTPNPDPEPNADPEPNPEPQPQGLNIDDIEKIIQSRVDKRMADRDKQYVELERKFKKLQHDKLTGDELKKIEDEEREKLLAEREKALQDKENRLYALKAIETAGLENSGDTFSLVDFVMGEDEADIDSKVTAFKALFDKAVKKAVDTEVAKRFKDGGYAPKKSDVLNNGVNPFKAETFNLTEQIRISTENPELAEKLKAAAGTK